MDYKVKENHKSSYQNVQQRESDQKAQETGFRMRMRKWQKILLSSKKVGVSEAAVGSSES